MCRPEQAQRSSGIWCGNIWCGKATRNHRAGTALRLFRPTLFPSMAVRKRKVNLQQEGTCFGASSRLEQTGRPEQAQRSSGIWYANIWCAKATRDPCAGTAPCRNCAALVPAYNYNCTNHRAGTALRLFRPTSATASGNTHVGLSALVRSRRNVLLYGRDIPPVPDSRNGCGSTLSPFGG